MATCENCGGHVTDRFRQVFGGNDGWVYGCRECLDKTEIVNGKPARPGDP